MSCIPTGDEICALTPPVGTNGSIPSTLASLILVDRQLDIVTPALHQSHLLDRIFGCLPTRISSNSRSQRGAGRASKVTHPVPGQRHESSGHGAVSPTRRAEEVDAKVTADAGQESDVRVATGVDGASKTEVSSEAATEGGSEAANEGWSDLEEGSTCEVDGTVQSGAAGHVHKAQRQSLQQPEQDQQQQQQQQGAKHQHQQQPMFSLR